MADKSACQRTRECAIDPQFEQQHQIVAGSNCLTTGRPSPPSLSKPMPSRCRRAGSHSAQSVNPAAVSALARERARAATDETVSARRTATCRMAYHDSLSAATFQMTGRPGSSGAFTQWHAGSRLLRRRVRHLRPRTIAALPVWLRRNLNAGPFESGWRQPPGQGRVRTYSTPPPSPLLPSSPPSFPLPPFLTEVLSLSLPLSSSLSLSLSLSLTSLRTSARQWRRRRCLRRS